MSSHNISACWLLAAIGLIAGCSEPEPPTAGPRLVRAIQVSDGPALMSRTFPGTVAAVDAVDLSFRVGGPLVSFPANQLGKAATEGELLAQIDARDFELRLRDARAALDKAKSELDAMRKARPEELEQLKAAVERAEAAAQYARAEYNRNLTLITSNAVSQSELELTQAKARLADAEVIQAKEALLIGEQGARPEDIKAKQSQIQSLEAAVQTAQDALDDTKLLAPFAGVVSAAYAQNFEVVQANQRIVRLVNTTELEIRLDIPENLISLVPRVTEAFVKLQAFPDKEIPARVAEIGAEASPVTRTYPVKLRFTPPEGIDVRPGMSGFAYGHGDTAAASEAAGHVVPAPAVFQRGEERLVWIFDPTAKVVRTRPVTVLGASPFGLNITGVEPGEWVVTAGVHYLEENQSVRLPAEAGEPES